MADSIVKDQPGEGRLAHAPSSHPAVPRAKVGVVLANLGTPDATDYWSMRRYLSEFLSDKRVVDYAGWKWQPLLQLIILTKRPFSSGNAYKSIWNNEKNESPLLTITRAQTEKNDRAPESALRRRCRGRFLYALRQPFHGQRAQAHAGEGL